MNSAANPSLSSTASYQSQVDDKIMGDLQAVSEKLDVCQGMLRGGSKGSPAVSVKTDPELLRLIGFLEACKPRLQELAEVGASQNAFSEQVLMKCLDINQRVLDQLQEYDTLALTETAASTTAASAPGRTNDLNLDDLLLDDESEEQAKSTSKGAKGSAPTSATPGSLMGKTTGEDDLLGLDDMARLESTNTANESAPPASAKSDDDFDSFFNERTTGQQPPPL